MGAIATIPGVPLLDVKMLTWRIIIWVCLAAFLLISVFAVVVKHVPVLGIQRAIAARVEGRWRERGHRKLDKLHARVSTRD